MEKKLLMLTIMAGAVSASALANAQTIKMGTVAPEGSAWHQTFKRIDEGWRQVSADQVKLKVFPGGVQGDEGDVVKKMRINQLQAAAVTAVGMRDISSDPQAVSIPLMVTAYDELDYVMSRVGPTLESNVEEKGFKVLAWADAGTIYFFSRNPAPSPEQMYPQKLFAPSGDPLAEQAWRTAGFTPVVLSSVNMVPSLQTGMVDAFASTPLVALTLGWYTSARNVTLVPWGTLLSAFVLSKKAWEKIPPELQPKILEVARKEAAMLNPQLRAQEAEALKTMQSKGLNVIRPSPEQRAAWTKLEDKVFQVVRGKVVSESIFDQVKGARDEFRAQKK
jgi:TRAP-type C4-dicarboxylate transport system substrate-binding protein